MYVYIYMYACMHTHKWKHTYHVYLHMYIVMHIQMCVVPNTDFIRNWHSVACPQKCFRTFWEHVLTAFSKKSLQWVQLMHCTHESESDSLLGQNLNHRELILYYGLNSSVQIWLILNQISLSSTRLIALGVRFSNLTVNQTGVTCSCVKISSICLSFQSNLWPSCWKKLIY